MKNILVWQSDGKGYVGLTYTPEERKREKPIRDLNYYAFKMWLTTFLFKSKKQLKLSEDEVERIEREVHFSLEESMPMGFLLVKNMKLIPVGFEKFIENFKSEYQKQYEQTKQIALESGGNVTAKTNTPMVDIMVKALDNTE